MDESNYVEMDEEAVVEFLGTGGTGVISFSTASDEPPYSLPVSYGYDAAEEDFFFRLAVDEDTEKAELIDGAVSFVVFEQSDEGWRSVVAAGTLESVAEADVASGILEGLRRSQIPLYEVFDREASSVSFEFVRLDPDELTGRTGDI